MKKIDGFITLNLIIICILSYTYYFANSSIDIFENNPELMAKLKRSEALRVLNADLSNLSKTNTVQSRKIASINKTGFNKSVVAASALDAGDAARIVFSQIKESCYETNSEMKCLSSIDMMISQFPESIWAGESLIILSEFYNKNNKSKQADELIKILKTDFKNYKSIQSKVEYLENRRL